jgi:hypothetical protein
MTKIMQRIMVNNSLISGPYHKALETSLSERRTLLLPAGFPLIFRDMGASFVLGN